jgi:hypothetical protein
MPTYRTAFMSHSHRDNQISQQYRNFLDAKGISVWVDLNNMHVGHDILETIENELWKRETLLLMLTKASNASRWVRYELNKFRTHLLNGNAVNGRERQIIPVLLEANLSERDKFGRMLIWGKVNDLLAINVVGMRPEDGAEVIARALLIGDQLNTGGLFTTVPLPSKSFSQRISDPWNLFPILLTTVGATIIFGFIGFIMAVFSGNATLIFTGPLVGLTTGIMQVFFTHMIDVERSPRGGFLPRSAKIVLSFLNLLMVTIALFAFFGAMLFGFIGLIFANPSYGLIGGTIIGALIGALYTIVMRLARRPIFWDPAAWLEPQ